MADHFATSTHAPSGTSPGNGKQDIFFDTADRLNFLARLARAVEIHGWILHATS